MSDVKSVKINDDARDVKDALARERIGDISELHTSDKSTLVDAINEVFDNDSDDDGKIGNLDNLMTDSKSNLVGAINEVYQSADDANDAIGDLSNLNTQNKGTVVGAVNELVGKVSDTEDDVTALTARVAANEGKIGDLSNLHTTDKDNLVEAINETLDSVGDIGDVNLPDLTNIQNTVDAINGVIAQTNSDLTTLTNRVQSDEGDIAQNTSDIGSLKTAVGDIELVTDEGYTDLSDAVKQIHDTLDGVSTNLSATDGRLGTNSDLSEPYADQIAANKNHIGDMTNLDVNGRDLVEACNYLLEQIGTLNNLSTTDKTSLVAAINEVAQSGGGSSGSGDGLVKLAEVTTPTTWGNDVATLLSNVNLNKDDMYFIAVEETNGTVHWFRESRITHGNLVFISEPWHPVTSQNDGVIKFIISANYDGYNYTCKVNAWTMKAGSGNTFVDGTNNITDGKLILYKLGSGGSGGSGGLVLLKTITPTSSNMDVRDFFNLLADQIPTTQNNIPYVLAIEFTGGRIKWFTDYELYPNDQMIFYSVANSSYINSPFTVITDEVIIHSQYSSYATNTNSDGTITGNNRVGQTVAYNDIVSATLYEM